MRSHDTVVIGKKDGEVVFMKTYDYEAEQAQAQSDLKEVIDSGLEWVIQDVTLVFKGYERNKTDNHQQK